MNIIAIIAIAAVAAAAGFMIGWLAARAESAGLRASLEHERKAGAEKLALLAASTEELKNAFSALSSEALKSNSEEFLRLARTSLASFQGEARNDLEQRQQSIQHLVVPLRDSLDRMDAQLLALEGSRQKAYGELAAQVASLAGSQKDLQATTGNLVKALRQPNVRGRWGEIQLEKVVELAGMTAYCDFTSQETLRSEEGRLRPDLVVRLPGGKTVVVDAKAPLSAYLDAVEATDENDRTRHLQSHVRQIRDHIAKLGAKAYWEQFGDSSPEFVVLFLPGEMFFSSALQVEPGLIEEAVAKRVILANPTTLIALLKAVYFGWRQEKVAENAQRVSDLGKELYERLAILADHFGKVGGSLDNAVEAYNRAVGTLESRVLVSARRFGELGCGVNKEIQTVEPAEKQARGLQSPDLT